MDVSLSRRCMVIVASLPMKKGHEEPADKLLLTRKNGNEECRNCTWKSAGGVGF